jgi:hypothetical protein
MRADAVSVGPRARERGAPTASGGLTRGGGESAGVDRRRGSTAVLRRGSGSGWSGSWLSTAGVGGSWWWGQFGWWMPGMAGPWRGGGLPRRRGRRRGYNV